VRNRNSRVKSYTTSQCVCRWQQDTPGAFLTIFINSPMRDSIPKWPRRTQVNVIVLRCGMRQSVGSELLSVLPIHELWTRCSIFRFSLLMSALFQRLLNNLFEANRFSSLNATSCTGVAALQEVFYSSAKKLYLIFAISSECRNAFRVVAVRAIFLTLRFVATSW